MSENPLEVLQPTVELHLSTDVVADIACRMNRACGTLEHELYFIHSEGNEFDDPEEMVEAVGTISEARVVIGMLAAGMKNAADRKQREDKVAVE